MKIFGIGFSRTGTTSLTKALEILGYSAFHYPKDDETIEKYDALTDITISIQYKRLDKMYLGSKFILTIREQQPWLDSMKRHLDRHPPDTRKPYVVERRKEFYKTTIFDKEKLVGSYNRHTKDVFKYFKNRDKDLLVLDICGGEGWPKLCEFLGKPIPKEKFPHLNINTSD